jgi:glycosyltransferase involved in cell wall biosynthesis
MKQAEFTGILRGEALAKAYAGMDVLAFPSHTDTYGNVVLEAFASGVPAVVTNHGGPQFIVRPGETGFVTGDLHGFCDAVLRLAHCRTQLASMRLAARAQAMGHSWDAVFTSVHSAYEYGLRAGASAGKKVRVRSGLGNAIGRFGAPHAVNEIR